MNASRRSVVFLTTSLVRAGAETQLVRLARELARRDWKVHVVSMLEPEALTDLLNEAGVPWMTLSMPKGIPDPRGLNVLVHRLRAWRPDALVTFMVHANLLGRLAGRLADVPVVVSSVRTEEFGGRHRDLAMRLTDRWSQVTVVNSRLAARGVLERGVVRRGRVEVIPNAVPAAAYRETSETGARKRAELDVEPERFLWLTVGRLEEQKDHATLLRAFARVRRRRPEAELRIAGKGPLLGELKALAAELGIERAVGFLGLRDDVPELLAASDAFVMSSRTEGLPNAVMEAMAAGLPVVGTKVGGIPELVVPDETGRLAPPGQPESLAKEMVGLMESPGSVLEAMGERSKRIVDDRYAVAPVVDRWESLLLELGRSAGALPGQGARTKGP